MSKFRKIGALWLKENDYGKFMSGTVQEEIPAGSKVMVFKNKHKKEDKHPDYTINVPSDGDAPRDQSQAPPADDDSPF